MPYCCLVFQIGVCFKALCTAVNLALTLSSSMLMHGRYGYMYNNPLLPVSSQENLELSLHQYLHPSLQLSTVCSLHMLVGGKLHITYVCNFF
jgi:hypothetical protein